MHNIGCLLGTAYHAEETRLDATLRAAGIDISPAEYIILRILFSHGTLRQCDITRIVGKDRAAISRSIATLTQKGYVSVERVSSKCSKVTPTEKGSALRPVLLAIAASRQEALAERITPEQLNLLRQILIKIIN